MDKEKRMIETYEVLHSLPLGDREISVGVDTKQDMPYLLCNAERTLLGITQYDNAVISEDYLEIMTMFTDRIKSQIQQVRDERYELGVDAIPLGKECCRPDGMEQSLVGKVLILKPSSLKPEYATVDHQLILATGGFGCEPKARGQTIFCVNLGTEKSGRWDRYDVLGVADLDKLPQWAQEQAVKLKHREKEKGGFER